MVFLFDYTYSITQTTFTIRNVHCATLHAQTRLLASLPFAFVKCDIVARYTKNTFLCNIFWRIAYAVKSPAAL